MTENRIDGHIEVPGHEKTMPTLEKIVAAYRKASFDSNGRYNFDQKRQDAAIKEIMEVNQFYTRYDAIQMLGKAIAHLTTAWKPPRSAP
jgi:hypothetical protein